MISALLTIYNRVQQTKRVANNMDPVIDYHTPQERQSAVMSKLSDHQPHQSSKQSHAEDPTQPTEATSRMDYP